MRPPKPGGKYVLLLMIVIVIVLSFSWSRCLSRGCILPCSAIISDSLVWLSVLLCSHDVCWKWPTACPSLLRYYAPALSMECQSHSVNIKSDLTQSSDDEPRVGVNICQIIQFRDPATEWETLWLGYNWSRNFYCLETLLSLLQTKTNIDSA